MGNFSATTDLQLIHFSLLGIPLCIDLKYVNKVFLLPELVTVPGGPPYLMGLMNFLGSSIPVIDLALRLGLPRTQQYNLGTQVLLCFNQEQQVGLIIDQVIGLEHASKTNLQMREEFKAENSPFLAAIEHNADLALMINMDVVLDINIQAKENEIVMDQDFISMTRKYHE